VFDRRDEFTEATELAKWWGPPPAPVVDSVELERAKPRYSDRAEFGARALDDGLDMLYARDRD
jgi:hypothetical protein